MKKQLKKKYEKIFVEAHRGASGIKHQNTIPAFDLAVEMHADAIELDIRKTKDGKIIVVHDPTYNNKFIGDWEYQDLLEETQKEEFEMPLFVDVLNKYKGKIILDVEIKEPGYEREIIDLIISVLTLDEFYIRSFHESSIRAIKEYNSDVYVILLIGAEHPKFGILGRFGEVFPKGKIKRSKCDAVSPNYQLLVLNYVKRMHRCGQAVYAWTVNDEVTIQKMIKKKVDGIVGNYPDIIIDMIKKVK